MSVFPLYSHYRMDVLLVSFYYATIPLTCSYLHSSSHSLVYSSLSLPISRVVPAVASVSSIRTSSIYLSIATVHHSILLFLHTVIIRFLSFPIYLFLDMCRGVYRLLTPCVNFPILPSSLPNITKKHIKTAIASGYSDKKYYLCSGNQRMVPFC